MSKSFTTKTIDIDWLSNSDKEFLSELVLEWLQDNNNDPESFSFSIEVIWKENSNE